MTGRFIAVVGPSGVGKDSVMRAMAAAEPRIVLARRVITRPSDAGGEDFDGVDDARFTNMVAEGAFALHWPAHGLRYGIPVTLDAELDAGRDVVANLSRRSLATAKARYENFMVISLTASRQVLAERLAARGRENADEVARRLAQADFDVPPEFTPLTIANDGPLQTTVTAALAALYPVSA
ncbi:phosphonate metabolism protein/1,5-bisphosphokinase (PRPP-forming) PhnN [Yoonia sp. BS5-3]|uniref:Ribose 1,5-bisphosphate phosphokinase PhnN n=1 Tax=Yoonia phaeophyticola TaxID=3137369 RepID=A0ABZ2V7P4_9RHOB